MHNIFNSVLNPLIFVFSMASLIRPTSSSRILVWFRNDLRVHDNPILHAALKATQQSNCKVLCLYAFDPRHFDSTAYGSKKSCAIRSQFLVESVQCLKSQLREIGSDLLVVYGRPESVISTLEAKGHFDTVIVNHEPAYEESRVERNVESQLKKLGKTSIVRLPSSAPLYHPEDLPFNSNLSDMSDGFTPFKEKVERRCRIRDMLPPIQYGQLPPAELPVEMLSETCNFDYMPDLTTLGFTEEEISAATNPDTRGVMPFRGGELAALARVQQWIFEGDHLKDYFDIRNGMLGESYSSKLSPWLAVGCISPRLIVAEVKRYERETGINNKSTYWLIFELIWRDFFHFLCQKHGTRVFLSGGAHGVQRPWSVDAERVRRWKTGTTGVPLVDANMRELLHTGWMSNRGRQNVASYLVLDLGVDWRVGADHFESLLIDHDVYSNYGNWNAAAGLTGGRVNKFNLSKQSRDYDSGGHYIRTWVPELAAVPAPLIFEPWQMSMKDQEKYGVRIGDSYPAPLTARELQGASPSGGSGGAGAPHNGHGGSRVGGGHGGGKAGGGFTGSASDRAWEQKRGGEMGHGAGAARARGGGSGGREGLKSLDDGDEKKPRRGNKVQHL